MWVYLGYVLLFFSLKGQPRPLVLISFNAHSIGLNKPKVLLRLFNNSSGLREKEKYQRLVTLKRIITKSVAPKNKNRHCYIFHSFINNQLISSKIYRNSCIGDSEPWPSLDFSCTLNVNIT